MVIASLFGATASETHIDDLLEAGGLGVLRSAGLLFFAFAGLRADRDGRRRLAFTLPALRS
ncbi:MAG: hypothetical protein M3138_03655 [Actinomycetota bacterium]|nr:hypothetical protein [Actinomycetota bacterium]